MISQTDNTDRAVSGAVLAWYDRHRRVLPWRAPAGQRPDPYHVWLSEIMLQQTTVPAVAGYFRDFLTRWPTVQALAAADLDAVLTAWAGLGYYARARNLHRCAKMVAGEHGGRFPEGEAGLRALPGIGAYTAAAIAAIAFDKPAAVMDGNIERVMARLFAVTEPLPGVKPKLRGLAGALTPADRPGDYAQAMMDLGATICTARKPKCILCPVSEQCEGRRLGVADSLPAKAAKPERPTRRALAFWATDGTGAVLLRRRPDKGLLGGMMEVPSSDWLPGQALPTPEDAAGAAPAEADWRLLPGLVRHTFTHFHLELAVAVAALPRTAPPDGIWAPIEALGDYALPTVMRKVVRHAMAHG